MAACMPPISTGLRPTGAGSQILAYRRNRMSLEALSAAHLPPGDVQYQPQGNCNRRWQLLGRSRRTARPHIMISARCMHHLGVGERQHQRGSDAAGQPNCTEDIRNGLSASFTPTAPHVRHGPPRSADSVPYLL